MKTLSVVAHPDLSQSRINRAWTERLKRLPDTTVHELYRTYPDKPVEVLANYVGAHYLPPFAIHNARHVTDGQLAESLSAYVNHLATVRHVHAADLVASNG
ncbi:Flavodoxin-like fold [Cohnella sp. OV330]|uniref:NAD(P)H-dependent oxidoreductase n=1 Tax=Cohnella sp. OV330 TaxID=1855288 RepID=UPI0008E9D697|nr:NAD(P)H-dependent oxidoreductase [Cohnella sp. OV330]SFB51486.1 Flavodoxin-like fold [Cohnella sp. OV330]